MVWCRQATSHYLSQCWLSYLSPYFVTRPQSPHINSCCHVLLSGIEAFLWSNACIVPAIGRAKHHVVYIIRTTRMFCSVTWIVLRYEVCKILEGYVFFLDQFWGVDDPFLNPNILIRDDNKICALCCNEICLCLKKRAVQEISQSWPVPPRGRSSTVHHPPHGVALVGSKTNDEGD